MSRAAPLHGSDSRESTRANAVRVLRMYRQIYGPTDALPAPARPFMPGPPASVVAVEGECEGGSRPPLILLRPPAEVARSRELRLHVETEINVDPTTGPRPSSRRYAARAADPTVDASPRVIDVADEGPSLTWYSLHDFAGRELAATTRRDRLPSLIGAIEPARLTAIGPLSIRRREGPVPLCKGTRKFPRQRAA